MSGTAVGAFAGSALVSLEPSFTNFGVIRHRSLREVLALMRVNHHTARLRDEEASGKPEADQACTIPQRPAAGKL
jgi:hypothetical protein